MSGAVVKDLGLADLTSQRATLNWQTPEDVFRYYAVCGKKNGKDLKQASSCSDIINSDRLFSFTSFRKEKKGKTKRFEVSNEKCSMLFKALDWDNDRNSLSITEQKLFLQQLVDKTKKDLDCSKKNTIFCNSFLVRELANRLDKLKFFLKQYEQYQKEPENLTLSLKHGFDGARYEAKPEVDDQAEVTK